MKQTTKKLFSKTQSPEPVGQSQHETAKDDRRSFLKKAAIGGLSLGTFSFAPDRKNAGLYQSENKQVFSAF